MNLGPYEKLVFLHFQKTAGTTLHDELVQQFQPDEICPARFPFTIRAIDFPTLDKYKYFSGHFTMDDVAVIPGAKKIVTFLRDPKDRILSLYYFWRAHSDEIIEKHNLGGPRLAKSLSLLEFLKHQGDGIPANIENIYVRSLLGTPRVLDGKPYYGSGGPDVAIKTGLAVLKSFYYVGFIDNFPLHAKKLCANLMLDIDSEKFKVRKRSQDSFTKLKDMEPVVKETITPAIAKELSRLTSEDSVLYKKAFRQFGKMR